MCRYLPKYFSSSSFFSSSTDWMDRSRSKDIDEKWRFSSSLRVMCLSNTNSSPYFKGGTSQPTTTTTRQSTSSSAFILTLTGCLIALVAEVLFWFFFFSCCLTHKCWFENSEKSPRNQDEFPLIPLIPLRELGKRTNFPRKSPKKQPEIELKCCRFSFLFLQRDKERWKLDNQISTMWELIKWCDMGFFIERWWCIQL